MYKHPPLITTHMTPEQIVGSYNMQVLIGHIKHFETNKDKPGRAINQQMGEIISRLQEHGYYIDGLDQYGNPRFMVALKGKCQQEMEGPALETLKGLSMAELQEMGRGGYRKIIKQQEELKRLKN